MVKGYISQRIFILNREGEGTFQVTPGEIAKDATTCIHKSLYTELYFDVAKVLGPLNLEYFSWT